MLCLTAQDFRCGATACPRKAAIEAHVSATTNVSKPNFANGVSPSTDGCVVSLRPRGQLPVRSDEVAGVAIRKTLEVILVLSLGFPERPGWRDLGPDLAGP